MKEITSIKLILENKLQKLNHLKDRVEKSLRKAPEGTLILSKSNGTVQYYQKTDGGQKKGSYINKKDWKLAAKLAQKDYDQKILKEIEKQQKKITRTINVLPNKDLTSIYEDLPIARKKLVNPYILTDEQYIERWENVPYTGKEFPGERASFLTERGEKVRSKTEKIIADKLNLMGIPYRYEFPLKLKSFGKIYPDFTLLNVAAREEIYLEHFGMMDNPEYCQKAILKIQEYAKNGIFPGRGLLITFETLQTPLDMKYLETLLREFVLK